MSVLPATVPRRVRIDGPVRAVSVISTGTVRIHPEHALRHPQAAVLVAADLARGGRRRGRSTSTSSSTPRGWCLFDTGQDRASVTDDAYFPGGFTGVPLSTGWPSSTSARTRLSPPSSPRSGTRPPTSTPRSSPTCTRTTSAGSRELAGAELLVTAGRMGRAGRVLPRSCAASSAATSRLPGPAWQQVSFEPTADPRSGAFHRVARRHGRRLARPAPHPRSHRRLDVPARSAAPAQAAAAAGRRPHLRRGPPAARPASRGRRPAAARRDHRARFSPWRSSSPAWSSCPPTTRPPPSACWTANTSHIAMAKISVVSDGQAAVDVLLLGAAGSSGRLIAAELAARGLSLRLAGRRLGPLEDLARVLAADGAITASAPRRCQRRGVAGRGYRGRRGGPVHRSAVRPAGRSGDRRLPRRWTVLCGHSERMAGGTRPA